MAQGTALKHMTRHILGLFQGRPGAKQFRRYLSENAHKPDAGLEVLDTAWQHFREYSPQLTQQKEISVC